MNSYLPTTLLRLCIGVIGAATLTGFVRWFALQRSILDHPNERSLHSEPTPRGGGLAIVAVVLAYLSWLGITQTIDPKLAIGIGVGSIIVALIGGVDDLTGTPPLLRLSVHCVAAIWLVTWLGGLSDLRIGSLSVHVGFAGALLAVVGIVWFTNLFNFMDGIDGIASVEGFFICAGGGAFLVWQGSPLGSLAVVTAGASLGFLWWNWEPAKVFLGDIGSGFLGFLLASIALASEKSGGPPLLVWAILSSLFIVDATITFVRRFRAGYWHEAHRSHAYQRIVKAGWSHQRVVSAVAMINVFLCGLAFLAMVRPSWTLALLAAAFSAAATVYGWVERVSPFNVVPKGTASEISGS